MCCAGTVHVSGMGGCEVGGGRVCPACNCEFSVVLRCLCSLRSTINGSWALSGSYVSAASIGRLEPKGVSERMQVVQLALSN